MKNQNKSDSEQSINKVLKHQEETLKQIKNIDKNKLEDTISKSEELLNDMGYAINEKDIIYEKKKYTVVVPTWNEMCKEASRQINDSVEIYDLFTAEELKSNEKAIKKLNSEFATLYKLDNMELTISVLAGLIASVIDILLIGIPQKTSDGLKAGKLSDYVRKWFDKEFPEAEMEKLANSKVSKVPYDAQDNRNTRIEVKGLSTYYHRLLTLGHDPFLGLIFGVLDILNGTMTSIDKNGNFVSQIMENYQDRKESDVFKAIGKQIMHFKSDVTTAMGLPAPFMSVFNLLQIGGKGQEEQTIAEIVQGMYYEGYDFIHFCSSSIPTMLIEVIVRMFYAIKKIHDGYSLKDSIPFSLNREKHPKLSTMLFIAHSIACSINAGKVYFKKNPLAINYPEWITFAKYSYKQLRWTILKKPKIREAYINNKLYDSLQDVYDEIDKTYKENLDKYDIILS